MLKHRAFLKQINASAQLHPVHCLVLLMYMVRASCGEVLMCDQDIRLDHAILIAQSCFCQLGALDTGTPYIVQQYWLIANCPTTPHDWLQLLCMTGDSHSWKPVTDM